MHVHAEVTVFDVSPLVDASRQGRWLDVQLWDRRGLVPRMLCDIKVPARRDITRQVSDIVEHLTRWLALDADALVIGDADEDDDDDDDDDGVVEDGA